MVELNGPVSFFFWFNRQSFDNTAIKLGKELEEDLY